MMNLHITSMDGQHPASVVGTHRWRGPSNLGHTFRFLPYCFPPKSFGFTSQPAKGLRLFRLSNPSCGEGSEPTPTASERTAQSDLLQRHFKFAPCSSSRVSICGSKWPLTFSGVFAESGGSPTAGLWHHGSKWVHPNGGLRPAVAQKSLRESRHLPQG